MVSQVRILVVDDEVGPRGVLKTVLSGKGFEVVCVEDGVRALAQFDSANFDLVLVDLMMPSMNGIDLLREIQERSPETLIVMITGYASLESAVGAIRAGAYDYLAKPFTIDELFVTIKNAVERISLIKENKSLLEKLQKAYGDLGKSPVIDGRAEAYYPENLKLLNALQSQLLKVYSRSNAGEDNGFAKEID